MHHSVLAAEKTLNHAVVVSRINFLKQMSSLTSMTFLLYRQMEVITIEHFLEHLCI